MPVNLGALGAPAGGLGGRPTANTILSASTGPAPSYNPAAGYGYGGGSTAPYSGYAQDPAAQSNPGSAPNGYGNYPAGSPAASYNSLSSYGGLGNGQEAANPGPTYGNNGSNTPSSGYAQAGAGAPTSAYGVPTLAAYGGLGTTTPATGTSRSTGAAASAYPGGSYGAAGNQPAAAGSYGAAGSYAPTGAQGSSPRATQVYGQTMGNWQPALPVSPWGTPGAPVVGGGGNVETATILKSDLKKLKRSRLKAWMYFFLLAGAVGYGGYLGFQDRKELVQKKNQSEEALQRLKSVHNETVAKVSGGAAAAETSKATNAAAPAVTGTATAKLADDLKRVLAGSPMAVETRGDRVHVFVDSQVLFAGREVDVGLGGYRTLYKFGKSLKAVKDRKIAVSVPSFEARKIKSWNLAAGRAVSLGRFFTDDLGFEKARVSVTAPAPRPAGKLPPKSLTGRIEFVLDPTGA